MIFSDYEQKTIRLSDERWKHINDRIYDHGVFYEKTFVQEESDMEKIKFPQGKSVNTSYDKEADVLYVSFGEPRASETLDSGEELLIRFDPETGEITGFTILNFSEFGQEIEELIAARAAA